MKQRPLVTVTQHVDTAPERIFDKLADGWLYPVWVVGAAHIRDVDANWPEPGSRVHHKVGVWPLFIQDDTEVVESDPPHRLVLQARGWPLGEARIEIEIRPDATGSEVTLREGPTEGPGAWLDNPLQRAVLRARNRETLSRLRALAERRP